MPHIGPIETNATNEYIKRYDDPISFTMQQVTYMSHDDDTSTFIKSTDWWRVHQKLTLELTFYKPLVN